MRKEIKQAEAKGADGLFRYFQSLPSSEKFKGFILIIVTVSFGLFLRFLVMIFKHSENK